eukprot:11176645-Alexandrium_andersonii.AAC.1
MRQRPGSRRSTSPSAARGRSRSTSSRRSGTAPAGSRLTKARRWALAEPPARAASRLGRRCRL